MLSVKMSIGCLNSREVHTEADHDLITCFSRACAFTLDNSDWFIELTIQ